LLAEKGTRARVVSLPSWRLFDRQDEAYRESVLPAAIKARVSIEAGATIGWHKYVGDHGIAFGIDHFGTSAPAAAIAEAYGFTPAHIADIATGLLAGV
jgi:transketolase